jgi:hypothetical protein
VSRPVKSLSEALMVGFLLAWSLAAFPTAKAATASGLPNSARGGARAAVLSLDGWNISRFLRLDRGLRADRPGSSSRPATQHSG